MPPLFTLNILPPGINNPNPIMVLAVVRFYPLTCLLMIDLTDAAMFLEISKFFNKFKPLSLRG